MTAKTKSVVLRFLRAFVAGAVSTMVTVVPLTGGWKELGVWLSSLALAGTIGGITGCLMAVDKYLRA